MRIATIVYSIIAIWMFGWLTGTFGFLQSLFLTFIFAIPAFIAWRITTSKRNVKKREYAYLGVLVSLAVAPTIFVVANWYSNGITRLARFDREYHAFRRHVSEMPEYESVEVSHTLRKGGRVYLHGTVENKDYHDRLIHAIEWMIRSNLSGYDDGVGYPGKPEDN